MLCIFYIENLESCKAMLRQTPKGNTTKLESQAPTIRIEFSFQVIFSMCQVHHIEDNKMIIAITTCVNRTLSFSDDRAQTCANSWREIDSVNGIGNNRLLMSMIISL